MKKSVYGEQGLHLHFHKLDERCQNTLVWLRFLYDRELADDGTTCQLGMQLPENLLVVRMVLIVGCGMIRTESYIHDSATEMKVGGGGFNYLVQLHRHLPLFFRVIP